MHVTPLLDNKKAPALSDVEIFKDTVTDERTQGKSSGSLRFSCGEAQCRVPDQ
jgi:hypothetical protein